MLIVTQYPIADCRRFVDNPRQLGRPCFVRPRDEEFLRHFGAIGHRRIRYDYCLEENHFCRADRALRIAGPTEGMLQLAGYESRLYHDGFHRCKVETKFRYRFKPAPGNGSRWLDRLLDQHYGTPVRIGTPHGKALSASLFKAGAHLANLYLAASSFQCDEQEVSQRQKRMHVRWIQAAEPATIVETSAAWSEMSLNEQGAARVEGPWQGVELYRYSYRETPVWIIVRRTSGAEALSLCRNIRTLLLHTHAERQSLLQTVGFIAAASHSDEFLSRPALTHLRHTLEKLLNPDRFGIGQTQIVDALFHADARCAREEYRSILSMFGRIDPKLLQQVDHRFIREDLDCLYSPVDFDRLIDRLASDPATEADPVCQEIVGLAQTRDRLGLKKRLRHLTSLSKRFAGSVAYDLVIECIKECMWRGVTGIF